ncbi:hypothetical protein EJ05DRAFT_510858 [Pseudovirgaria hyperparasitica]|uniref:Uncharacterized protein n=1 Tax=Pseudovirgaria hyperparasitica TaxID=470096 RepID=A0A6A6W7S9_9PEZI|nr:uncharacterized protein EJ05DRAFT_510858 [Pseudovirgaria hyperparasitica]KAF2758010.1 hypothetical protein EJ05DRAFT_510858 [Pseudovirgaria hyperparasitica]
MSFTLSCIQNPANETFQHPEMHWSDLGLWAKALATAVVGGTVAVGTGVAVHNQFPQVAAFYQDAAIVKLPSETVQYMQGIGRKFQSCAIDGKSPSSCIYGMLCGESISISVTAIVNGNATSAQATTVRRQTGVNLAPPPPTANPLPAHAVLAQQPEPAISSSHVTVMMALGSATLLAISIFSLTLLRSSVLRENELVARLDRQADQLGRQTAQMDTQRSELEALVAEMKKERGLAAASTKLQFDRLHDQVSGVVKATRELALAQTETLRQSVREAVEAGSTEIQKSTSRQVDALREEVVAGSVKAGDATKEQLEQLQRTVADLAALQQHRLSTPEVEASPAPVPSSPLSTLPLPLSPVPSAPLSPAPSSPRPASPGLPLATSPPPSAHVVVVADNDVPALSLEGNVPEAPLESKPTPTTVKPAFIPPHLRSPFLRAKEARAAAALKAAASGVASGTSPSSCLSSGPPSKGTFVGKEEHNSVASPSPAPTSHHSSGPPSKGSFVGKADKGKGRALDDVVMPSRAPAAPAAPSTPAPKPKRSRRGKNAHAQSRNGLASSTPAGASSAAKKVPPPSAKPAVRPPPSQSAALSGWNNPQVIYDDEQKRAAAKAVEAQKARAEGRSVGTRVQEEYIRTERGENGERRRVAKETYSHDFTRKFE